MPELPIYLDHNATTPCDPRVVEAMVPYFTQHFGNAASRSHVFGWRAEEAVEYAREQVATLIGAEPKEVIFTSGATEADNLALKGVYEMYAGKGNHIITMNIEHKAVLDSCKHLEKLGAEISYLRVNGEGLINLQELEAAIKPATILIAIMFGNNEIGVVQPVREIGAIARKHGVLFFTDATQAVGKTPVDVNKDYIDLLAMTAHKMYGPKGIGAVYIKRKSPKIKLVPIIHGGGQERELRSGTLNVPSIVGFGEASAIINQELSHNFDKIKALRDYFEKLLHSIPDVYIN
ncbi:MAG: aminotransferase class V-fold PLP-dependent enzyme, partial [Flavisolibacter sp.]|nr:aminotransferase class V-fold PLP-dependent enzyme [Flavisolibacter sp.]